MTNFRTFYEVNRHLNNKTSACGGLSHSPSAVHELNFEFSNLTLFTDYAIGTDSWQQRHKAYFFPTVIRTLNESLVMVFWSFQCTNALLLITSLFIFIFDLRSQSEFCCIFYTIVKIHDIMLWYDLIPICSRQIHTLNDETRGATMEVVISRMKTVDVACCRRDANSTGIKFVAVSATIPNVEDVSEIDVGWFRH